MKTIDMTPTWEATVQIIIAILENKNASFEGKQFAREELIRLAKYVDNQKNKETE